jgi:hypothetical protein
VRLLLLTWQLIRLMSPNASNLSSGSVPLAQLGNAPETDVTGINDDIALLGFKVASNGSLARYNLVDQSVDAFEDDSGVDASASTNEKRSGTNNSYSGGSGNTDITAFLSSGTFTTDGDTTSVEVLVVAGGGGTSGGFSGGGGAGGLVHHAGYTVTTSTAYGVTVGGAAADSVFDTAGVGAGPMTANAGGSTSTRFTAGSAGGSGGGGGYDTNNAGGASNQSDSGGGTGYGFAGGAGIAGSPYPSGGGGGAGGVGGSSGADTSECDGPVGGAGKYFASFIGYGTDSSNVASTGANGGWFAGGGGGSRNSDVSASFHDAKGNDCGGGGGGQADNNATGASGLANTGGGAGGGWNSGPTGGTGVVLVKNILAPENMTLVSNATTAIGDPPTNGDLVITTDNQTGTTTPNTDIKAYISRDGSAYTSAVTLVSQGTTGGHTILTANGVDLSGITSGTSMRWKIETLNQTAAKITRIQGVSLGWS